MTFDLLMLNGTDVRGLRLLERKRLLLEVMPQIESRARRRSHSRNGVRLLS